MNTDNTILIKKTLEQAAGYHPEYAQARSLEWASEGMERLPFETADGMNCGYVEIRHGQRNSDYVRMELQITPDIAAKVIALVTGTQLGVLPDMTEVMVEDVQKLDALEVEINNPGEIDLTNYNACAEIPIKNDLCPGGRETFKTQEQIQADSRNAEIAALILQQRKDKETEKEEKAEKEEVEKVEELDFDLPADKER